MLYSSGGSDGVRKKSGKAMGGWRLLTKCDDAELMAHPLNWCECSCVKQVATTRSMIYLYLKRECNSCCGIIVLGTECEAAKCVSFCGPTNHSSKLLPKGVSLKSNVSANSNFISPQRLRTASQSLPA